MKINSIQVKNIITKSNLPASDFVINPYIGCTHNCLYCYAEFMKKFTHHTNEKWCSFLDVKNFNALKYKKNYKGKLFLISSVTDPYNKYEVIYKKTQSILEQLLEFDSNFEILTKSPLITRDIQIIKKFKNIKVGISIAFHNDEDRKIFEPNAPSILSRINALKKLKEAGIETYVFISPIFPMITDIISIINLTKSYTTSYMFENLNLRGEYKKNILYLIKKKYPDIFFIYEDIFNQNNTLYWDNLLKEIESLNINKKIFFYHKSIKKK
ncbi:MAG: radical SAM protein [Cetobacterium sp.]|nr:radical SAM protein [Cetobacterium sp.]